MVNHQRIKKMEVRHKFVEQLKEEVKAKLRIIVSDEAENRKLIRTLIVQGLLRMMEKNVSIEAPNQHKSIVSSVLKDCQDDFAKIMKSETDKDMGVILKISDYSLEERQKDIIGGVFLRSNDGLIVCDNSLDARVDLIFEHLLPTIRGMLFPSK